MLMLIVFTFLAVEYPHISNSKRIYGHYFYNVNSTFYIWYDSWDDVMQGTRVHGDRVGWPDMPEDQIPSGSLWAARVGNHKLVLESWESVGFEGGDIGWRGFANRQVHDPPLLFDLSTDLGERLDIAEEHPELVEAIQQTIERYHASFTARPPEAP